MFRFTIRDLLWLTVVVALGVAWWMDRAALTNEVQSLRKTAFGPYSVDDKTGLDEFIKLLDQQAKSSNPAAPAPSLPRGQAR
jgi:hypothetical protein